jgi:hypothetical protein
MPCIITTNRRDTKQQTWFVNRDGLKGASFMDVPHKLYATVMVQ